VGISEGLLICVSGADDSQGAKRVTSLLKKYFFKFTPDFSQVTTVRSFDWKPSKRFQLHFQFRNTWLKPGVNERDGVLQRDAGITD